MDTVSYPKNGVADFIEHNVIPLRVPYDHPSLAADFGVTWTPTIIILDQGGKEHHRTVGFLAPEDLKASVLLGMAKISFDHGKFADALFVLENIIEKHPANSFTPEAIFLRGVSKFKNTHDPLPLKEAYLQLTERFPESEWARRSYPYRLL